MECGVVEPAGTAVDLDAANSIGIGIDAGEAQGVVIGEATTGHDRD